MLGPCVGTSAMIAACADFVVLSKDGELALASGAETSAEAAAQAGDAALVAETEEKAIAAVRALVTKLPSNNLETASFIEEGDAAAVPQAGASAKEAAQAVVTAGSALELTAAFGKSVYTGVCKHRDGGSGRRRCV